MGSLWAPEPSQPPEGLPLGGRRKDGGGWQTDVWTEAQAGWSPRSSVPVTPVAPSGTRSGTCPAAAPTPSSWSSWGHRPEKRRHLSHRLGICFGRTPALVCLAPSPKERRGGPWQAFPVPASVSTSLVTSQAPSAGAPPSGRGPCAVRCSRCPQCSGGHHIRTVSLDCPAGLPVWVQGGKPPAEHTRVPCKRQRPELSAPLPGPLLPSESPLFILRSRFSPGLVL